jgi:2-polyprenyl-6-methoxyphenol hydroxylase-like FAD-dependent oxidoreductase
MNHNKKILVIGAGIAGPTVCYWLKKYGFSPTLIERSRQIRTGGHAVDIRGIAANIVKKMGIYNTIIEKRTSIMSTRHVNAEGRILLEEHGEQARFREGDDIEIVRGELVNILLQTIPDVPCFFHKEIVDIVQKDHFVEVIFKSGTIEHYDLVVGADGLHSSTRSISFEPKDYQFLNLNSYISIFSIPNYLNLSRTEVSFGKDEKYMAINSDKNPDGAIAIFAFRSDRIFNDVTDDKRQKKCLRDLFDDFGWESNNVLAHMDNSKDFYFDVMAQIKMPSWTKNRVALLGDAGYCASPLSGQGTNLAIVGAYILAGELKLAKGNYSVAFERYNEIMRLFVEPNQELGILIGENFLSSCEISKETIEQRSNVIMQKIKMAANAI